jgi:ubiquinone/menaquinone biosynthesis C-methylase UbiE
VHVTGLDVSPGMLQRARARAARLGLPADLREGDARALPFADAAFDVVILHLILAVAPDPELVARESARVLRRGGRVSVFDKFLPLGQRPSFLRSLLNVAARRLFSDLNRHVEPLLAAAHLTLVSDLPGAFGGRYRHLLARKP